MTKHWIFRKSGTFCSPARGDISPGLESHHRCKVDCGNPVLDFAILFLQLGWCKNAFQWLERDEALGIWEDREYSQSSQGGYPSELAVAPSMQGRFRNLILSLVLGPFSLGSTEKPSSPLKSGVLFRLARGVTHSVGGFGPCSTFCIFQPIPPQTGQEDVACQCFCSATAGAYGSLSFPEAQARSCFLLSFLPIPLPLPRSPQSHDVSCSAELQRPQFFVLR